MIRIPRNHFKSKEFYEKLPHVVIFENFVFVIAVS